MKRIGILTYHKSENYGAFMQCYSLACKLKSLFPNESVEVVDYTSKEVFCIYHQSLKNYLYLITHAQSVRKKLRYLKLLISYIRRSLNKEVRNVNHEYFDEAQRYLPLSTKQIITDNYERITEYLNKQYDILIVGSDAVWNWQIRPFPNVYFLGKEIKTRKLSYAASSYGQAFRSLSHKTTDTITKGWQTYDYIGVRDLPTEEFVSSLGYGIMPIHNCDPTVFLDMTNIPVNKDDVLRKLKAKGYIEGKKTIGIMAKPWLAKFIREHLSRDYQIVSVFQNSSYADVNLLDINPFEWAVCFGFFDVTITHYFHGNLLSLKNGTPTIIIEQKSDYNQKYDSKIRDFMKRVNLLEYCHYIEDMSANYNLSNEVEMIIGNHKLKNIISDAIKKESLSFNSFKETLSSIINE